MLLKTIVCMILIMELLTQSAGGKGESKVDLAAEIKKLSTSMDRIIIVFLYPPPT